MTSSNIRRPQVAGQFYPSGSQELKEQIAGLVDKKTLRKNAIACILPHAGYMYSGRVAVQTISQVALKDKIVLLGPNHTGYGEEFSLMPSGTWQTPLGEARIDANLAKQILSGSKYLKPDNLAHMHEHSLEVELPILQFFKPGFTFVPISFLSGDIKKLKEIGREIALVLSQAEKKGSYLLIASSDMTHYERQEEAERKDKLAIQAILELDADKLAANIHKFQISMCGYAPVVVMIEAAKSLGAKKGRLVRYETSGDVTGDKTSVVGYAGIIIS
ncbi:MAG: AmmeMemoRadiSam system protein B [Candidatus Omnitrophica bacterium]|nr:AmmeMemoRadiSam system protein B [Candidatus Omnitrophota bacterium]